MVAAHIGIPHDQIADFCRKWKIAELSFFGSVLCADFGPHSDVDVLFTMETGYETNWDSFWSMKEELETLLGRPVDYIERKLIEESPNWIRRNHILSTCRVVYAAG